MNNVLRPNYRRARALALEIEAAKNRRVDCGCDLRGNAKEIEDLKAKIAYLEREFSLTGVLGVSQDILTFNIGV